MATAVNERATTTREKASSSKPLPAPNGDFYEFAATLPAEELAIVKKVRAYRGPQAIFSDELRGRRREPAFKGK